MVSARSASVLCGMICACGCYASANQYVALNILLCIFARVNMHRETRVQGQDHGGCKGGCGCSTWRPNPHHRFNLPPGVWDVCEIGVWEEREACPAKYLQDRESMQQLNTPSMTLHYLSMPWCFKLARFSVPSSGCSRFVCICAVLRQW